MTDVPTPTIGRVVIYKFSETEYWPNHQQHVPAFVVNVFPQSDGPPLLNLRTFPDAHPGLAMEWRTSVVHESRAEEGAESWSWPERV